jgi:YbbR domain-containing protein
MNRIGLKVACLLVALVIWIQVASNHNMEEYLYLPLEVTNLPTGTTVVGSDIPRVVRIRLRGSKLRLMAHRYLGRNAGRVVVDLAGEEPGPAFQRELTINDVRSDLDVLDITPPIRLRLRLDHESARLVPVVVTVAGKLQAGRLLLGAPRAEPDSVVLKGPERYLTANLEVHTASVDLSRIRETSHLTRRLDSPSPYLILAVPEVEVTVSVARVESRTLSNVPIVPLVDADQPQVSVFPPVVDLSISGPADSLQALVPSRVAVTVPLSGLAEGVHHIRGQVILPDGFTLLSMEPEEFMVIIGKNSGAEGEPGKP